MGNSEEVKVRTVPRSNEKAAGEKASPPKNSSEKKSRRWIIYVGTASVLLGLLGFMTLKSSHPIEARNQPAARKTELASTKARINETVTKHLQDAEIKRDMMMRVRELENLQFKDASQEHGLDDMAALPDSRSLGVQLDTEDTSERVYEDLNSEPTQYSDLLPGDRINARLARQKWVNEQERAEKIEMVGNYIRAAADSGYEVEIDKDLVVVGAHRMPASPQKMNINQVMDRLAREGGH